MRKYIGLGDFEITQRQKEYVSQALNMGRLSYGPLSKRLEQEFASLHACRYAVLSNSGTSSLLVALQTLKELHGWQDGDEVIVPALTFVATVNVVLQLGLKPILVDVEPDYYGIDIEGVNRITYPVYNRSVPRAIIPVHTFGQPVDMSELENIQPFGYRRMKVIEDSCETMFVKHYGNPVGSWGDIACFSTYMAHIITTGVGGIATTNNPDYALKMRSLVNHGMSTKDLGEDGELRLSRDFAFDSIGHSFRLTELEAALGLAQLEEWEEIIGQRQDNAHYLMDGLVDYQDRIQLPATRPSTEHAFMMFPLVCEQEGIRDNLRRHLHKNGIGTRLMLPLISQPCYKGLWDIDDYPVAREIDRNGFYIPVHQHLTQVNLDFMIEKIGEFFR